MAERSELERNWILADLTSQSLAVDIESIFQGGFQHPQSTVEARPKDHASILNESADPKYRRFLNRALELHDEADQKGVNKETRSRLLTQAVGNYSRVLSLMARQNEGERNPVLEAFIRNNIGAAHAKIGNLDEAVEYFEKAVDLCPEDSKLYDNLGRAYYEAGNFKESVAIYVESIKIKPDHADSYHNLGISYLKIGDENKAITYLNKTIEIDPNHVDAHYNLGAIYIKRGYANKSIEYFEKLNKIKPDDVNVLHALGVVHGDAGNYANSIGYLEKAAKFNPKDALIYYHLGVAYSLVGNRNKAIEYGYKAIDLDPDFVDALFNLGNEYVRTREFNSAIKYFKKAIEQDPRRLDAHINLGNAYEKSDRFEEAIESCLNAIAIDPKSVAAYHNLGIAYARANNFEDALNSSLQAIRINPDFAVTYIGRGLIYLKKGERDEAEEDFIVALSLDPELYREEYAYIFADVRRKIEEDEAPWNELRAALIQAQSDAEHEQPEGWTTLLNSALEAVDKLAPLRKDIRRLNRAAKYLAVEECRDVRTELGYVLNEALDRLGSLAAFQRETARHALSMEASGEEKDGFAAALLRLNRSLDAIKIEEVNDDFLKIRADNSMQTLRYLQTRIKTGGRKFTWEEANER